MDIDQGQGQSTDLSDSDIDSLLQGNDTPSRNIPMKSEPEPQVQEYSFKHGDKEVKAPIDKILHWAQMGYDYPNKAKEWNQTKAQLEAYSKREQELKEIEQKWAPYKQVDEYAAKNPDWWAQVQEQYKQKLAGAESNPEIQALKQELAELKKFRDEYSTEKKTQQVQEEDQKLSQEVESIRKQFSNLDFDTPDESGKSLEMKVLEHAMNNDIKSFRVAFRDFYHDHLLSKAREEGKELVSKEVQKRTKLGILGESPKPTKGLRNAENVKDKSYEALMREALEELNN